MAKKLVGKVTHFFNQISVAVIELKSEIKKGDEILIERKSGEEFKEKIDSMQIEHKKVDKAGKGQSIGLKVSQVVREGDLVYKE